VTTTSGLTLDAGALIALQRGDRRLWVLLDETERAGRPIVVPVVPLSQVWRDGARQAALARFLNATDRVGIVEWDAVAARRRSAVWEDGHFGRGGRVGGVVCPGA